MFCNELRLISQVFPNKNKITNLRFFSDFQELLILNNKYRFNSNDYFRKLNIINEFNKTLSFNSYFDPSVYTYKFFDEYIGEYCFNMITDRQLPEVMKEITDEHKSLCIRNTWLLNLVKLKDLNISKDVKFIDLSYLRNYNIKEMIDDLLKISDRIIHAENAEISLFYNENYFRLIWFPFELIYQTGKFDSYYEYYLGIDVYTLEDLNDCLEKLDPFIRKKVIDIHVKFYKLYFKKENAIYYFNN